MASFESLRRHDFDFASFVLRIANTSTREGGAIDTKVTASALRLSV